MRLRSPATIASTLLIACALALLGVALAMGGHVNQQRPWLHGVFANRFEPAARGRPASLHRGHTLSPILQRGVAQHRNEGGGPRRRVARAQRAPGALAVARGVALGAIGPTAPGNPSGPHAPGSPSGPYASPVTPAPQQSPTQPTTEPIPPSGPADPPDSPAPSPPGGEPVASALYWGASIGSQLTGEQAPWDMGAVAEFEQIAGKQVSLVNFFGPFANCASTPCSFYRFPTGPMESIRKYGAIPVYSWSSQSIPSHLSEPDFQLGDVIAGTHDAYIREFAEDARDWGHPFFLRFNWEMNGRWFPWSEGVNGNQPGEFVAAWRHVHDIFDAVGADNVTWVWCPNVDPDGIFTDLASLYPGDAYVDWTGLDGYNWGLNPAKPDRWRSFDELYAATYNRIVSTIAPAKPLLIGEIGSTEKGGSKAAWIQEALTAIPASYPKIGGLLWFDTYDDGMDWPIETSASAAGAFAEAIQSPAYVDEGGATAGEGPIPPPS